MSAASARLHRFSPRLHALIKAAVTALNTPVAKARARRVLAATDRPLRLEVGGLEARPGWLVTNVGATARHYLDATATWPLEDGSLSHVYADNVIEHIDLAAARRLLREAHRCLVPGGVLRLVTPDLRAHVDLYLAGSAALQTPAAAHYRSLGLVVEHPTDLVRIPVGSFGHHAGYVYDFATLRAELVAAGFVTVVRTEPGSSDHAELSGLDVRTTEGGAQLAVEATRGG